MKSSRAPVYALGLDIGTSSVRGIVHDRFARPVPGLETHVRYAPLIEEDGGVTVDVEVFLHLVFDVLDRISGQATERGIAIDYVGTSCFWHSLVALDEDGAALTPVLLWADTRSSVVLDSLSLQMDADRLRRLTGAGLHASYWPAKLLWLEQTQPETYIRSRHFVSAAEVLFHRLFGTFRSSISQASGTGLMNSTTCEWDEYACSVTSNLAEKLSPLDDRPLENMTNEMKRRWPALAGATWFAPAGDGACANIGCGGWERDRFAVTIGTSSAMRVVLPQPVDRGSTPSSLVAGQKALWNYRVDADRGVVGGALGEGGNLIAWLHGNLKLPALSSVESEIATRGPDAGRLTILPFIAGERSPGWEGEARLTVLGIGLGTKPVDILQAAMEAVAYQLRTVYEAMVQCIGRPRMVVASGAALGNSGVWRQILANVLEERVAASQVAESSSRGAAILALVSGHGVDLSDVEPLLGEVHEPDGSPSLYRYARRRQMHIYDLLRDVWKS